MHESWPIVLLAFQIIHFSPHHRMSLLRQHSGRTLMSADLSIDMVDTYMMQAVVDVGRDDGTPSRLATSEQQPCASLAFSTPCSLVAIILLAGLARRARYPRCREHAISKGPKISPCNPAMRLFQNSQFSSTDLMAQSNFSRRVLEKNFSMGTPNFLENTTVRRGSM